MAEIIYNNKTVNVIKFMSGDSFVSNQEEIIINNNDTYLVKEIFSDNDFWFDDAESAIIYAKNCF